MSVALTKDEDAGLAMVGQDLHIPWIVIRP